MEKKMKTKVRDIIDFVVLFVLWVVFLLNISAVTVGFIRQENHKMDLQKKDVTIQALLVACEMDFLIKNLGKE